MIPIITSFRVSKMEMETIAEYAFMAVVFIAIIAGLAYGYNEWDTGNMVRHYGIQVGSCLHW